MIKRYKHKTLKRKIKIRAKLLKIGRRPRLSVFRSNKYIYAQIIDDQKGKTLAAASEKDIKENSNPPAGGPKLPRPRLGSAEGGQNSKINRAFQVGQILAKKALKIKIKKVYFDRGGYKYHGLIKALAEGARKGGLEF